MAFYAARQPILDTKKQLVGYELLFRSSLENIFPKVDQEKATSKMMEGLYLDMGLDHIAEGKTAFINFTKQSLLNRLPALLPADKVTIEVLESVQPTKLIYQCLMSLYEEGYTIALDDFVHSPQWEPFYQFCKVIKVDCMEINERQIEDILQVKIRHPHITLLAEKVEDLKTFEYYKSLGFSLFQGFFFAKPEVIKSISLSSAQSTVSTLLSEVNKPELDIETITQYFEMDTALSFRLLRYVQSPLFKRRNEIESIKQAIIVLGKQELERFVSLLFAATFSENKPNELIKLCLQRAKFCELLAIKMPSVNSSSAFLVGMMSLLDAMLDAQLAAIVATLPLSDEIKVALVRRQGSLFSLLQLCEQLEQADWQEFAESIEMLSLSADSVLNYHLDASEWADNRIKLLDEQDI